MSQTTELSRQCPAILISAPASGQGKTSITAGLARHHQRQGRKVVVFKIGPDFLDPKLHTRASGNPVYQVDLWMTGEEDIRYRLALAAQTADLIIVEGVMGAFDGVRSSADFAQTFNIPVLFVINASSMAATFGAIAHGLTSYQPALPVAGVLANQVASNSHETMLREALRTDCAYFGSIFRNPELKLPSRHLGLVIAAEVAELEQRLNKLADAIGNTALSELPAAVDFSCPAQPSPPALLAGKTIAVAQDAAFAFIYLANIDFLHQLGATVVFFSPLTDQVIPEADALWLPGGYPELHGETLANNQAMLSSLRAFAKANKPIFAECGGMLYLLTSLSDTDGRQYQMANLLPGHAVMQSKLSALGYQSIEFATGELRGHSFHYSTCELDLTPACHAKNPRTHGIEEPVYQHHNIVASYCHCYFPGSAKATAALFSERQVF